MNRDVDLTENGQFTDTWSRLGYLGWLINNDRYPWEFSPLAGKPIGDTNRQMVLTGNYKEIQFKKLMNSLEDGEICERCGKRLIKLFNTSYMGLCDECEEEIRQDVKGSKWLICDDRNMPITRQMIETDIVVGYAHNPEAEEV